MTNFDIYTKNKLLEKNIRKLGSPSLIYCVGIKFLYTPVSECFKRQFHSYLKELGIETDQPINVFNSIAPAPNKGYIQKRKEPRLKPNDLIPEGVEIEGISIEELLDISIGGIKFNTKDSIRYGERVMIKITFEEHVIDVYGEIRHISPIDLNSIEK